MSDYGRLQKENNRFTLNFERTFSQPIEEVYAKIIDGKVFSQWYPFATGAMEGKVGGKIAFDDGEGTTYEGVITAIAEPTLFAFQEGEDVITLSLRKEQNGCRMVFVHTFDDDAWAVNTAAGWHRCLDVFMQIVNGASVEWADNVTELQATYRRLF